MDINTMIGEIKEKVTGVIPALSTGWFGRHSYSLIVTNRRIILAKFSNKLMKEEREKVISESNGEGFLDRWKASVSSGFGFHERYHEMDPEEILEEDKDNYEFSPEQVRSIKIKSGNWDPEYGHNASNEMIIDWSEGREKFKFDRTNPKDVKNILKPLLGSKIR